MFCSFFIILTVFFFKAILKDADLTSTSAKKVRQELEEKLETNLQSRKKEIDDLVMEFVSSKDKKKGKKVEKAESEEEEEEDEEEEEVCMRNMCFLSKNILYECVLILRILCISGRGIRGREKTR